MYQSKLSAAEVMRLIHQLEGFIQQAAKTQISTSELRQYQMELLQQLTQFGHAGAAVLLGAFWEALEYKNIAYGYYQHAADLPTSLFNDLVFNYPNPIYTQQDYISEAKLKCHQYAQEVMAGFSALRKIDKELNDTLDAAQKFEGLLYPQNSYSFFSKPLAESEAKFSELVAKSIDLADKRLELLVKLANLGHAGAAVELGDYYNCENAEHYDTAKALFYYQQAAQQPLELSVIQQFNYPNKTFSQADCIKLAEEKFISLTKELALMDEQIEYPAMSAASPDPGVHRITFA